MKRIHNITRCGYCNSEEKSDISYICPHCFDQMNIVYEEVFDKIEELDHLYTVGYYEGLLKEIFQRFKFEDHRYYARSFGQMLLECGYIHDLFTNSTGILYVPMTKKEIKKRGFQQCQVMVEEMKQYLPAIPVLDVLKKVKETKAQLHLSEIERNENLKGAFRLTKPIPSDLKTILLIDDIYTTGATLREVAKTIQHEQVEVIGLVLGI